LLDVKVVKEIFAGFMDNLGNIDIGGELGLFI